MAQHRCLDQQVAQHDDGAGPVLGRDQVGVRGGQAGILGGGEHAPSPLQVVVDELGLREAAKHLGEESRQLGIVEGPPPRQSKLESAQSALETALDPLDDGAGRQADQPDHGVRIGPFHLRVEEIDDLVELALGDGITLAGGAEDIEVPDAGPQVQADLLAEGVGEDLALRVPGNADRGQDDAGVAGGFFH